MKGKMKGFIAVLTCCILFIMFHYTSTPAYAEDTFLERNVELSQYLKERISPDQNSEQLVKAFYDEHPEYLELEKSELAVRDTSLATENFMDNHEKVSEGIQKDRKLLYQATLNDVQDILFYSDGSYTISTLDVQEEMSALRATSSKTAGNTHELFWGGKLFLRTYVEGNFSYNGTTVWLNSKRKNYRIIWPICTLYDEWLTNEYTDGNRNVMRVQYQSMYKHISNFGQIWFADDNRVSCNMQGTIFRNDAPHII